MKIQLAHTYQDIISVENLLLAWEEFLVGKHTRKDVQIFERYLMDHILKLHEELRNKTYQHGGYESFYVNDPKRRHIHKAGVRDRLVHHAVFRVLYPFFERTFIADSYSCRVEKGTHKAVDRFRAMYYKVSHNQMRPCWVLKCDIRKFFASFDHGILLDILKEYIPDSNIVSLLGNIISSFSTEGMHAVGMPLGNLTSQLFANVYMNPFDQWVKHTLKARYYIRYADDFVFLAANKIWLDGALPWIDDFLHRQLHLQLHPNKVFVQKISSGVDFLGWKLFPDHRLLRRKTERRMLARIAQHPTEETLQSYLGMLKHGNTQKTTTELLTGYYLSR